MFLVRRREVYRIRGGTRHFRLDAQSGEERGDDDDDDIDNDKEAHISTHLPLFPLICIPVAAIMPAPRNFAPTSSSSSISDKDPHTIEKSLSVDDSKDDALDYVQDAEAITDKRKMLLKQPLWKRIFTGDVDEQYQVKRAMGSRHLVMIGR